MGAFMNTLHNIFQESKPTVPCENSIQICIPTNLRFSMYETLESVEYVNHFTPIVLRVPLLSKMDFGPIRKVTDRLKNGFGYIYAMCFVTWVTAAILPRFAMTNLVSENTKGFTAAFSNVRGPAKQMFVLPKETGKKSLIQYYCGYISASG